ncbi:MAG TPA: histidine kinase, partial [Cyclobacteriaceae bacterium]|nr:histidine kinase [Cyclobacteriaceae bacterium]
MASTEMKVAAMTKHFKDKYFTLLVHAGAWSIALFFPFLLSSVNDDYKIGPLPGLYFPLQGIPHIMIFYVNAFFLYPRFLNRRYWYVYAGGVVLLIMLSFAMKLYILSWWFPDALEEARSHILFPSLMVFLASVFYSIAADRIRAEKQQKENNAMRVEMELKFLRSQISPHFLFNILTNLVLLARKKSDQLEASLLMLSGLMRYMLHDAGKKISLQQEVEYLESYVALQNLRFGRDVNIIFKINISPNEKSRTIEPMLLIPFIENAFKHGTGYVN